MHRVLPLPLALVALYGCNSAPSAPDVSIGPVGARTDDDLVAVVEGSDDQEGDEVTFAYAWKQDGLPRNDLTTDTVPASETVKGEVWEVSVTPNDGELDGEPGTATATVLNTPPVVTVAFAPEAPATDDDLVAVPAALDADGDAVSVTYTWTVDGTPADYTFDTVPADATTHGERWAVTVTPADDEEAGEPVVAEVEIANSAPVMLAVTITPEAPYADEDVVALVEAADADGDTVTYTWFVDGDEVQAGANDTLPGGSFAKHQRIGVEVVPNDGAVDGAAMSSADAVVINRPPVAGSAAISPNPAYEASTLSCTGAGFTDIDGDTESWTYAWAVDGADTGVATATLDGSCFSKGSAVSCSATPFDGEDAGVAVASAALTIANTPPVLASADLSTLAPTENDTITVTLGAATDDDGDAVSYGYDWYVDGALASTSSTLPANRFARGDSIYVVVTP